MWGRGVAGRETVRCRFGVEGGARKFTRGNWNGSSHFRCLFIPLSSAPGCLRFGVRGRASIVASLCWIGLWQVKGLAFRAGDPRFNIAMSEFGSDFGLPMLLGPGL